MNTTIFLIVMVLTAGSQQGENLTMIPMPNMALCKVIEDGMQQYSKNNDVLFFSNCLDVSEEEAL